MENQSYVESVKRTSIVQSFFAQVYGWMFFGLLSTGIVAYYTAHSPALLNLIFGSQITFYAFLFAPIVLVMIISSKINSLSASMASFLFFVYSAVTGVTLSAIFLMYTQESIATTFGITAGTFGATALFGYVTKKDLSKMRWMHWVAMLTIPLGYLAGQAGWVVAECGRQPWAIQDMLPTSAAISKLDVGSVQTTFFIFLVLFTVMLIAEVGIMLKAIRKGPEKELSHQS